MSHKSEQRKIVKFLTSFDVLASVRCCMYERGARHGRIKNAAGFLNTICILIVSQRRHSHDGGGEMSLIKISFLIFSLFSSQWFLLYYMSAVQWMKYENDSTPPPFVLFFSTNCVWLNFIFFGIVEATKDREKWRTKSHKFLSTQLKLHVTDVLQ